MIRVIFYPKDGQPQREIDLHTIPQLLQDPANLIWVSLEKPDPAEFDLLLGDIFHFHPLAIEDCTSPGYQTPKVDDFGEYLFIISQALKTGTAGTNSNTEELNIFLGSNYMVTSFLEGPMLPVEKLWNYLTKDDRLHNNGSDFLCHALIDYLVDDYLPHLDDLEDEIDGLENYLVTQPKPEVLPHILNLKHYIMRLRRTTSPMREVMNRLSRDDFPFIDRQSQVYFRDVYDHLVRINDMIDLLRDMTSSALDVYLNSTSLKLNQVMKALTIVSTIFLPLSFVAGVYGMNFKFMPELNWPGGYPFVWVIFILIVAGMLVFFWRKKWF